MKLTENLKKSLQDYFAQIEAAERVYIFGSYARGDAKDDSDIDMLLFFDFENQKRPFEWFLIVKELSALTGKKIDLVNGRSVSKYIAEFIDKDKILIYERGK